MNVFIEGCESDVKMSCIGFQSIEMLSEIDHGYK